MSIPTTTEQPTVRRAQAAGSILQEGDLPPGTLFIDGAFRPGDSASSRVIDPSSATEIAQVTVVTVEDTDIAVTAAYAAKDRWAALTPKQRSELLHRVADHLAENADLLAQLKSRGPCLAEQRR